VRNLRQLLRLHNVAEAYGRRPSEVLGVPDEWAAYQLDSAALLLARHVEQARADGEDVAALLDGRPGRPDPGRFRSPAGLIRKGKPSGRWPGDTAH
jgi:hypothetical protein